jgi:hypothetical protein
MFEVETMRRIRKVINQYPSDWRKCIGVLYYGNEDDLEEPFIACKHGFTNRMSIAATKILREKYFDVKFNPKYTYVFEVCEGEKEIYLLDVFWTKGGTSLSKQEIRYEWTEQKGPRNTFPTKDVYGDNTS